MEDEKEKRALMNRDEGFMQDVGVNRVDEIRAWVTMKVRGK